MRISVVWIFFVFLLLTSCGGQESKLPNDQKAQNLKQLDSSSTVGGKHVQQL